MILFTLMMDTLFSSETRLLQEPNGVPYQDTSSFIVTVVSISDLT
jgi:hypothetical protein